MSSFRFPSVTDLAKSMDERYSEKIRIKAAKEAISVGRSAPETDVKLLASSLCEKWGGNSIVRLINGSGIVMHTGLGRARLSKDASEAVSAVASQHASVELDLDSGKRGDRQNHVEWLLMELSGAEAALVVNNCAGALVLALSALCLGKDVVLSRGQMVEIGGSFRVPDIIVQSGCRLVEVGCTNKTYISDYLRVTDSEIGAWLTCHQSNFSMTGFVDFPEFSSIGEAADRLGVTWIDDMGSGCLVDTTRFGLPAERTLQDSVRQGATLSLASGDKLLGGPQAGILVGQRTAIEAIKKHPLARALRIDKLCLAGLEATLRQYFDGRELEIPVWRSISKDLESVKRDAERLASVMEGAVVEQGLTELGGGSMPGAGVPTWRCGIAWQPLEQVLRRFRLECSLIGRIENGMIWFDPRTIESDEMDWLVPRIQEVFHG